MITVRQLKEELSKYPEDAEVRIRDEIWCLEGLNQNSLCFHKDVNRVYIEGKEIPPVKKAMMKR